MYGLVNVAHTLSLKSASARTAALLQKIEEVEAQTKAHPITDFDRAAHVESLITEAKRQLARHIDPGNPQSVTMHTGQMGLQMSHMRDAMADAKVDVGSVTCRRLSSRSRDLGFGGS